MTGAYMAKLTARDALHHMLVVAQEQRQQRNDWVPVEDGGQEVGWVLYERAVMLAATNRWREVNHLPPVDEAVVRQAEDHATGHVDYTAKFALYCAEIAVGEGRWTNVR
jgi:hypothetical protein